MARGARRFGLEIWPPDFCSYDPSGIGAVSSARRLSAITVACRRISAAAARICSLRVGITGQLEERGGLAASARLFCSLRVRGIAIWRRQLEERAIRLRCFGTRLLGDERF